MSRINLLLLQVLVAVVSIALWYVLTTYPVFGRLLLPPFFFSNPVDVAKQIVAWFASGVIWKHLWVTLIESLLAFVIGSIGGVLVGFWFARQPRTAAVFDPYVKMINALPRVVLAPLFVIWLGIDLASKVALAFILVAVVIFFTVFNGIRQVDRKLVERIVTLGGGRWDLVRHVYLPSVAAWVLGNLKIAVGFAFTGACVGEFVAASRGLGYLLSFAQSTYNSALMFALIFLIMVVVLLIFAIAGRLEQYLLRWS